MPEGIRRVVDEELESAVSVLKAGPRDESIHEARKSVKKIRGVLRLVRGELGPVYQEENGRFRAIGQKLSELRDAAALLEVFDHITGEGNRDSASARQHKVRRGLERAKRELEQKLDRSRVARQASGVFRSAKGRVARWPLRHDGFGALAPGLEDIYRRGRKALKSARKTGNAVNFHDLRKRVKDHWYHVRLLESTWTEVMQAHEASLKELETWLGDDHNLVVLREKLEAQPDEFGGEEEVRAFLNLVETKQAELRRNSLSLAERVYSEKPRVFVRHLENLWQAWQDQPESMKEIEKEERAGTPKKPTKVAKTSKPAELKLRAG